MLSLLLMNSLGGRVIFGQVDKAVEMTPSWCCT